VAWLLKLAQIRACVKAGLPEDPDNLDQQNMKAIKRLANYGNCMTNALLVLEDSMSMCLQYY